MSSVAIVDAVAKYLAADMHGVQVAWAYFVVMLGVLLLIALARGTPWRELVRSKRPLLQSARGMCLVLSLSCLFFSLTYLPLAEATVIAFSAPLFIVALSGPVLGEKVGWQRWVAVLVGMTGAIIVARPGMDVLHWSSLVALAGAFFFAWFNMVTRMLGATDRPMTTLFYTFAVGSAVLGLVMPLLWTPISAMNWVILIASGALGVFAHFAIFNALKLADASLLAPINYIRLLWAIGLGILMFGDYPDWVTVTGGVLTVVSGLYVVRVERR